LLSEEHFTVDGTLIQVGRRHGALGEERSASRERFRVRGRSVVCATRWSPKTDPERGLFKKATADKSVPSYQGHALMENRSGLVVGAEASQSATNAEREVALDLLDQVLVPAQPRNPEQQARWEQIPSIRTRSSSRPCASAP